MRKIYLSTLLATIINAASPMVPSSMSTDNGGTKKAIDAYSDGAGVLLINQAGDTKIDNSAMNKLVFKYGDAAKSSNTTLKNQVNVLSPGATALEKADAVSKLEIAKIVINPPVNGASCDDGNIQTTNDTWMNSVCAGSFVENQACDDTNAMTYGDKYVSGICTGTYATTCKALKIGVPSLSSGIYIIDPDSVGADQPFSAYCDMTFDGGGWTQVAAIPSYSSLYGLDHIKTATQFTAFAGAKLDNTFISDGIAMASPKIKGSEYYAVTNTSSYAQYSNIVAVFAKEYNWKELGTIVDGYSSSTTYNTCEANYVFNGKCVPYADFLGSYSKNSGSKTALTKGYASDGSNAIGFQNTAYQYPFSIGASNTPGVAGNVIGGTTGAYIHIAPSSHFGVSMNIFVR